MSALAIRPATAADLPAVLALYGQPDLDGKAATYPIAEAQKVFARFARYPDYVLYVAEDGDAVVGTFALLIMDNLMHGGTPSAIVEDVAVDPARQGAGIGQAMMRFAMAVAGEKGCYKMMLSSNIKRERAHAFYDQLGFRRHGVSFLVDLPVTQEAASTEAAQ